MNNCIYRLNNNISVESTSFNINENLNFYTKSKRKGHFQIYLLKIIRVYERDVRITYKIEIHFKKIKLKIRE